MRPESNPLDLNNLPEEYGKQPLEESSTTTAASTENSNKGFKKKKKEGKDESDKVYECRFCSLKFCKSQALGGHMNRHRQERETETLNRARQLVFSNDSIAGAGAHMGLRDLSFGGGAQTMPSSCFQQVGAAMGDPRLHFRPVYPRLPNQPQPHQLQPYMYSSPSSSYQPSYPPAAAASPPAPPPMNTGDYYVGRALAGSSHSQSQNNPSYTLFGTSSPSGTFSSVGRDHHHQGPATTNTNPTDGGSWSCTHRYVQQHPDEI